jgi:hypothetical protein
MTQYLNDGSHDAPKLRVYLNADNLYGLPEKSIFKETDDSEKLLRLKADGFEGIQVGDWVELYDDTILPHCGLGRINEPGEALELLRKRKERGDLAVTLHVGWGMESDAEMDRLVDAILSASEKLQLPTFIETHRATITQDIWRTVELCKRIPEVRFNGDFSHFYCGQEMVYGDFEAKLDFMQPIFDRVGFMHGRIAASSIMQAPIERIDQRPRLAQGEARDYLADFKTIWRRAMGGFKSHADKGDFLIFAPELLTSQIYYARLVEDANGALVEDSDRYAEALLYRELAKACFEET